MSDQPQALMLFAAGKGTRMGALTKERPKPLIPVAGRPLIDQAVDLARAAGVPRIVANVHYLAPMISAHLEGSGVAISDETDALLETGGGLRLALPKLGIQPVFTLNADAAWTGPNPLTQLRAAWDPGHMDALLLLVPTAAATGHQGAGDFARNEDGKLRRGSDLVYTGAQILATDLLAEIPAKAFSLNAVWNLMIGRQRLYGVVHRGGWCDVGSPAGIDAAEAMLKAASDV